MSDRSEQSTPASGREDTPESGSTDTFQGVEVCGQMENFWQLVKATKAGYLRIPVGLFQNLRQVSETRNIHMIAAQVLALILYRYQINDQGHSFLEGDALVIKQRALADKFAVSKDTIQAALNLLKKAGAIKRALVTVYDGGIPCPNSLEVKINIRRIAELCYTPEDSSNQEASEGVVGLTDEGGSGLNPPGGGVMALTHDAHGFNPPPSLLKPTTVMALTGKGGCLNPRHLKNGKNLKEEKKTEEGIPVVRRNASLVSEFPSAQASPSPSSKPEPVEEVKATPQEKALEKALIESNQKEASKLAKKLDKIQGTREGSREPTPVNEKEARKEKELSARTLAFLDYFNHEHQLWFGQVAVKPAKNDHPVIRDLMQWSPVRAGALLVSAWERIGTVGRNGYDYKNCQNAVRPGFFARKALEGNLAKECDVPDFTEWSLGECWLRLLDLSKIETEPLKACFRPWLKKVIRDAYLDIQYDSNRLAIEHHLTPTDEQMDTSARQMLVKKYMFTEEEIAAAEPLGEQPENPQNGPA